MRVGSAFAAFLTTFAMLTLSACGLGMFGNGKDPGVANQTGYQPVNLNCSNLQLSSAELDVPSFRALLHCFNSYHALDPVEALTLKLTDGDLAPAIDAINRYMLRDLKTLYQLQQTYYGLGKQGTLDQTLAQFGNLLGQDQLIASALQWLEEAYNKGGSVIFNPPSADPHVLKALEFISTKVNQPNFETSVNMLLNTASSRVYGDLQTRFQGVSPNGRKLGDLMAGLWSYVKNEGDPEGHPIGREFLQQIAAGNLFPAFDTALGRTSAEVIRSNTNRMTSGVRIPAAQNGSIMNGMTSLFHFLNRPISCMKGAQNVPNGDREFFGECVRHDSSQTADFIRRTQLLTLSVMKPLCDFPDAVATNFPSVMALADQGAAGPSADLIKAFYQVVQVQDGVTQRPLEDLIIDLLSDTGGSQSQAEDQIGIKRVIPLLAELQDRGSIDDLMLLTNSMTLDDRQNIVSVAQFLLQPIPEEKGASVYDTLLHAYRRTSSVSFLQLISSVADLVQNAETFVKPSVAMLRSLYYLNDVHPFLNVTQKFLADASLNNSVIEVFFKAASFTEFRQSLQLISKMANDGRLKQLTDSLFTLYGPLASQGASPVNSTIEPPFQPNLRHDWIAADLVPYKPSVTTNPGDPCHQVDLSFSIDQVKDPNYDTKLGAIVNCLGTDPDNALAAQLIDFMRTTQEGGTDLFRLTMSWMDDLQFGPQEFGYISNSWLQQYDSGQFTQELDALPYWISAPITVPGSSAAAGPVLEPLIQLALPLMTDPAKSSVRNIENFVGPVLQNDDTPQLIKYVDTLVNRPLAPEPEPIQMQYDIERIMRWVGNKECQLLPTDPIKRQEQELSRAVEVIDDFDNAITSWDTVNGKPRRSWTLDEFKPLLEPVLDNIANPAQNMPGRSIIRGMLNWMNEFTLSPGEAPNSTKHFYVDDLWKFVKPRSDDYRLVTYFYHDWKGNYSDHPQVRFMNSLDRLELTLVDADFQAPWPIVTNSSLQFTGQLAEAWGDEPRQLWPPEIQAKFPVGSKTQPLKLADVVNNMYTSQGQFEDIVGLPKISCKEIADPNDPLDVQLYETTNPSANGIPIIDDILGYYRKTLWNLHEVLSVMQENLPYTSYERAHPELMAQRPYGDGLKIMRGLLFQLYYSTPVSGRNPKVEWKNNLKVIDQLTRLGIMHQIGRAVRGIPADDPGVQDVFRAIINGSVTPHTEGVMKALFVNQYPWQTSQDQLFWGLMGQVFDDLGDPNERALLKQLGFYTLAAGQKVNIIGSVTETFEELFGNQGGVLMNHLDSLGSLLDSSSMAQLTRALYEDTDITTQSKLMGLLSSALVDPSSGEPRMPRDFMVILNQIDQDPAAKPAWDLFRARETALLALPDYAPFLPVMSQLGTDTLHFFEEQSSDPGAVAAAQKVRLFLARRLIQGDLNDWLELAAKDPNKFYQLLEGLSQYIQNGELGDFFAMIRRSLSS